MLSIGSPRKRKKMVMSIFFLIIVCSSMLGTKNLVKSDVDMWLNLTLKTSDSEWGIAPDIALYIADYLEDIGINVDIIIEPWNPDFFLTLFNTLDFDLALVTIKGVGETPDFQHLYKERNYTKDTGVLNIFGLKYDIPYSNLNELMLDEGLEITDFEERQQHYYDWQSLMMNKIIPLFPLFNNPDYVSTWTNTLGYDSKWGIADCLPYMSFDSLHEGQVSLDEFNFASSWGDLNPLYRPYYQEYTQNTRILNLIHEPIIQWSPEQLPIKTGLIHDWEKIDDCHYKFFLRDNVFWNPSYNVTFRDAGSPPLDTITTGELMLGLKNSEYSNGSNQKVTAKDAVFSLLAMANPLVSATPDYLKIMSDIYVDPSDPLAFHLHIDGDPDTSKLEPYADFWMRLTEGILPEFFLNSSDPTITESFGGVKTVGFYPGILDTPQWEEFSFSSAFGCGKYMLDYFDKENITVFQRSPYWFGIGALDGSTGMTPFAQTLNAYVFADQSVELAEFKSGKLDWMKLNQFPVDRRSMEDDQRFNVSTAPSPNFSFLAFNLQRPIIGGESNFVFNPREDREGYTLACSIRKAICYAINKTEINEEVFFGEKTIAHSVIYPYTEYYYYDDIIKYQRDLESAFDWLDVEVELPEDTGFPRNAISIISLIMVSLVIRKKRKKKIMS